MIIKYALNSLSLFLFTKSPSEEAMDMLVVKLLSNAQMSMFTDNKKRDLEYFLMRYYAEP